MATAKDTVASHSRGNLSTGKDESTTGSRKRVHTTNGGKPENVKKRKRTVLSCNAAEPSGGREARVQMENTPVRAPTGDLVLHKRNVEQPPALKNAVENNAKVKNGEGEGTDDTLDGIEMDSYLVSSSHKEKIPIQLIGIAYIRVQSSSDKLTRKTSTTTPSTTETQIDPSTSTIDCLSREEMEKTKLGSSATYVGSALASRPRGKPKGSASKKKAPPVGVPDSGLQKRTTNGPDAKKSFAADEKRCAAMCPNSEVKEARCVNEILIPGLSSERVSVKQTAEAPSAEPSAAAECDNHVCPIPIPEGAAVAPVTRTPGKLYLNEHEEVGWSSRHEPELASTAPRSEPVTDAGKCETPLNLKKQRTNKIANGKGVKKPKVENADSTVPPYQRILHYMKEQNRPYNAQIISEGTGEAVDDVVQRLGVEVDEDFIPDEAYTSYV
ncbi:hypothetical protein BESB_002340 [Besnoitia besnoiti]|uniref:Uncharacterized protein n=1 Tax=Besnoitia besnoiti TaxID=94643 RepID=A0A2A9MPC4_BESBE|nr:hypothetical protein BESB_002340 [Besnoitia besnoiti]PFH37893.1 hypothetical protein BESB_002340 [Besnoitia besnoiti]